MRGKQLLIGLFSVGAMLSTASACARTNELGGDVAPESGVGVQVKNNNFLDMDVYAVSDGMPTRLGTVTGNSSRSFVIDPSFATQDLRIVATPIGGNGRAGTGAVLASPGQTIVFTIGSTLASSSVYVR
jgi:hypothetical protein